MGIKYVGPDAVTSTDLVTLGVGDARWAGAVDLSTLSSRVDSMATSSFAGSARTSAPICEVALTTGYTNGANSDAFAGAGWTAQVDTDSMFRAVGTGSGIGNTTYSRMRIPFAGRWLLDFWVEMSSSTVWNGSCKIMAKTGTTAPSVTADSIATSFGPSAGNTPEGCPLHASYSGVLTAGTIIYWSTFRTVSGPVQTANFGGIQTKIVAAWLGPN
ncbi:hypothetical protein BH787_gp05 [Gordonia phage GMA4]|uniref:hypothetical protein n=1 Tax=Gordonia phage GMA4 TaxID=1647471 RepID=UPI0006BC9EB6|nr:hypothetical protein BH787_gp05 [Gordonia phage GMA4]AKJ72343.1 hypothetical protein GMA4_68 [Gordonia phage GMA4]